jgi:hypothetical protein
MVLISSGNDTCVVLQPHESCTPARLYKIFASIVKWCNTQTPAAAAPSHVCIAFVDSDSTVSFYRLSLGIKRHEVRHALAAQCESTSAS